MIATQSTRINEEDKKLTYEAKNDLSFVEIGEDEAANRGSLR